MQALFDSHEFIVQFEFKGHVFLFSQPAATKIVLVQAGYAGNHTSKCVQHEVKRITRLHRIRHAIKSNELTRITVFTAYVSLQTIFSGKVLFTNRADQLCEAN